MKGDGLDDLIDRGLRDYVAKEPELGMESRVLRGMHRRESRLRITLAVAACLLVGVFGATKWQERLETLAITPLSARIDAPALTRGRVVRRKPGVTAGERALLQFVQDHPEQAVEVFAMLDSPIPVDDIEIAPLTVEPPETKEENEK